MNRIFYTFLGCCLWAGLTNAQETIFLEDFTTVATGTGYPASMSPSITIGQGTAYKGTALINTPFSTFNVNSSKKLQANALRGEVKWETIPIDISCYSEVYISATVTGNRFLNSSQFDMDLEDYFSMDVTVVEEATTYSDILFHAGQITEPNFATAIPLNSCGSSKVESLVLTFRFANDQTSEGYTLDDVKVVGYPAEVTDFTYMVDCGDGIETPDLEVSAMTVCQPEYSLDNITFQSSGTFEDLMPGAYTVYVRDYFYPTCDQPSFNIMVNACPLVLPIELVDFRGAPQNEDVLLAWETATEVNNDYMAVERSRNGVQFAEIGRLRGAGTTTTPQSYQFLDRSPESGLNYYRLRQVDLDGSATYHPVIAVELPDRTKTPGGITLYPTVASNSIRIELDAKPAQQVPFTVYSLLGQSVLSGYLAPQATQTDLPVQELPAGSYIFSAQLQDRQLTARFVKQ